jgi:hypothetical protein
MGFTQHLMKAGPGKLAFDPSATAEASGLWRRQVRSKLAELLSFPEQAVAPRAPARLWSAPRMGYRLEKWEAYPEPGSVVPFLLLIPDAKGAAAAPAPAVMCFPGSASTKELLAGEPELRPEQPPNRHAEGNQMALQYAQAGFVAVVAENPGMGSHGP